MTDLATLTEGEFWPLIEQARDRVLTNDVDALEALIVAGLPPDEMQAAAWALVQRVRGLRADLMRVQRETQAARTPPADEPWNDPSNYCRHGAVLPDAAHPAAGLETCELCGFAPEAGS